MTCKEFFRILRILLFDICLSIFNLVLTFVNINLFLNSGDHRVKIGSMSIFFLWFPGIITSGGFIYIFVRKYKLVSDLETWKLFVYPLCLLLFYPVLPLCFTLLYLVSRNETHSQIARLARLFAAFLDHGPQFVLRVIVVVLSGLPHSGLYDSADTLFVLALVASILSLVGSAVAFNERNTAFPICLFLSVPMFSAIFGCRAFTLAVFIREIIQDGLPVYQQLLCTLVIVLMVLCNLGLFRWSGQDWIRSIVFSLTSVLVPTGYNNDHLYYQLPHQNLLMDKEKVHIKKRKRQEPSTEGEVDVAESTELSQGTQEDSGSQYLLPMESGKYLLSHVIVNDVLLWSCSTYIYLTSDLKVQVEESLVISQILCVVPGLCFAIGRSFLHDDILPLPDEDNQSLVHRAKSKCRYWVKILMGISFALLGGASVVPALWWSLAFKIFSYVTSSSD